MDQTFSTKNMRRIFDIENRRGRNLSEMFFPEVLEKTQEIRVCVGKIKSLRKQKLLLSAEDYDSKLTILRTDEAKLREEKETLLEKSLKSVSDEISNTKHKITLTHVAVPEKKPAFRIDNSAASYFAVKTVQRNLHRLYKVK